MTDATETGQGWGALSSLPGNPIMWVLIISELLVFGAFFLGFGGARLFEPEVFRAGQARLDIALGGANTLILVSSGWLAAKAVQAAHDGRVAASRRFLAAAGALGVAFLAVKGVEYADKAAHGIGIETDTFWTLFYLMTGFHAMHVVMGIIVLAIVGWRFSAENIETGTAFWHMVDLIWLILFPIVYLVR
ncbi:cytochrome c oxidase subunit 3 [Magnetospirillum sp. UT-4]|uniref:cytochrome c oxidase subunit 3 n=1 Tax=Magnetospirillum sp. UT-4 TaxID=2681467 RepID=UPI0015746BA6|nr:cytochrome c oxidase subunit 3 [Magnetospirillum sp. UT-4]